MRFEKLYRTLTANLGLKIVSLVVALLLWLYVTAQQGQRQGFKVPLELEHIPDSLTVMQEVPAAVEVTVSGTKSDLLKLRFLSKMRAVVDCSAEKRGTVSVPGASSKPPRRWKRISGRPCSHLTRALMLPFRPLVYFWGQKRVSVRIRLAMSSPRSLAMRCRHRRLLSPLVSQWVV